MCNQPKPFLIRKNLLICLAIFTIPGHFKINKMSQSQDKKGSSIANRKIKLRC